MKSLTTVLITLLTLETVQASFDNPDKYKKVGDTVVLSPGSVAANITSIIWKHGSTIAVKWDGGESVSYGDFKGRCTLKTTTGELTISNLTPKDSGSYTVEIKIPEIMVISEVPTPTVSESCDAEKTQCVLTCEGITTDAEPVTYTWWSGDVMKSQTKELSITKEEKSSFFRCTMKNPFSTKRSNQVVNPVLIFNTDNPGKYEKVGDTVVFSPGSVDATITSIVWKHGSTVAVKWDGGESVFYGDFKDRCKLKTTTGELTISNLTPKDSGSYTVEINGDAIKTTKINVISEVPTPTVSESCDAEKTQCVLTCEGITTDSGPVTYTWWSGNMMKSKTKELSITKEEKSSFFRCMMKNPVSTKRSNQVVNPVLIFNTDNPGKYKKVGDTVVFSPGSVAATITSIVWKHGSTIAVKWDGGESVSYGDFKDRCKLKTTTGELTISNLTPKDSGSYTVEINGDAIKTTKINVISEVPTPTVSESCDAEKTQCVLTCEGITTDSGPVVYTWWSGNVTKSQTKELSITKEEKLSFFRCMMENPVSTKRSNQVVNPVLISNTDNPDIYKKVGDTVVFSPGSVAATITSIVWKHGSAIAVKWDGGESVSYGDFKGRCTLKTTTGELTISNLTPKDSGSYTVEINGDAIKTTKMFISAVPTPTISKRCDDKMTYCVFTCEFNNTAGAEQVTYTWWSGDVMKSETKELNITKEEEKDPSFICKVENPFSSERSKEVLNPFLKNSQSWIVVVVLIPVVGVGIVILVLYIRKRKGKKVNKTDKDVKNGAEVASDPLLDENKHAAESNQDQKNTETNEDTRV